MDEDSTLKFIECTAPELGALELQVPPPSKSHVTSQESSVFSPNITINCPSVKADDKSPPARLQTELKRMEQQRVKMQERLAKQFYRLRTVNDEFLKIGPNPNRADAVDQIPFHIFKTQPTQKKEKIC